MAKLEGSYTSLVRGVSEQVPHDRLEGQHFEQVNMVSDPIRGLVRRRGSMFKDKIEAAVKTTEVSAALKGFKEHSFSSAGNDYAAFHCSYPSTEGPTVIVFNKDTESLIPVNLSTVALSASRSGLSAAVSVGRYLLLSRDGFIPGITREDLLANATDASIWIRGGAYSRTYTVTYGTTVVEYTTPKSYYEGVLDTSDISSGDSQYQKKVNDRVNAYNTAVNQYIAEAQEAIQPENIATELAADLNAAGITCTAHGPHIHVEGLSSSPRLVGSDGGDGSFMRVSHVAVGSLDDLTKYHVDGAVVAIEVTDDDVYYVKANAKNPAGDEFQEVIWREGTKEELTVEFPFLIGTVWDGEFYIAESPEELEALLPSGHGLEVPRIVDRKAGDETTNPEPDFFGRPISYMSVFQDRLVVCSGANVFLSVPGDYFNWFRKSALRVDPDDPIETYALGAEDDTIRGGSLIDRNLILLGDSLHYAISGRDVLSPTNAIVSVQAAHEATTDADPQALGNLLFYSQFQGGLTKLHQMQVGAFADSFENFSVTQQITRYIEGRPRQLLTSSQPNLVFMTTEDNEYGMYVFAFLDSPGQTERLFDSWSRWEWDESLGELIGITNSDNGVIALTYRETDQGWFIVADEFSRDSSIDDLAYADSKIMYSNVAEWAEPIGDKISALSRSHPRRLTGRDFEDTASLLSLDGVEDTDVHSGVEFPSFFEPTPPFPRDDNGNAVLSGRLVLSSLGITLEESAGITVGMQLRGEEGFEHPITDDSGFRVADPLSPLGAVPLTNRRVSSYVGREVREHRLRIAAKGWTPLNIATIEWVMQIFNRR